jgi:hypothetical protein
MMKLDPSKHPHLGGFAMMPTAPGTCPECAVKHETWQAHNQQSLTYQYDFYGKHGRWPTWKDAIAHCTEDVKAQWIKLLAEHGVIV